jgi:hypothetical protein
MPASVGTVTGKSASDLRIQTDMRVLAEIVMPAVTAYIEVTGIKCWDLVDAAIRARKELGTGNPKDLAALFCKAFDTHDRQHKSNRTISLRVVKVAFHYSEAQLKKVRELKSFNDVYNAIPKHMSDKQKAKASLKQVVEDLKEGIDSGIIDPKMVDVNLDSENRPMGVKSGPNEPPVVTGWIDPKVRSKRSKVHFEGDDWREESLAIIEDQFDRFLKMIEAALEKELTEPKKAQLIAWLTR